MKIPLKLNVVLLVLLILAEAKLTDTISWVWAFAPMWIPLAVVGVVAASMATFSFVSFVLNQIGKRK